MKSSTRNALFASLIAVLNITGCTGHLSDTDSEVDGEVERPAPEMTEADGGAAPGPTDAGGTPRTDPVGDAGAVPPPSSDAGPPPADGERVSPSSYLPERVLFPSTVEGVYVYNPHTDQPHAHAGSGHTHAEPDHSAIDPSVQEARFRDLSNGNAHDFVWMTAHQVVVADPGVSGLLHMYGAEIYTGTLPSGGAPHVLAFLPDGALAGRADPFGPRYRPFGETLAAIADSGGLPVLAHPSRYSPSVDEVVSAGDVLWGIELISGGTDPADNAPYVDARLSAGRYTCLSAGGDTHDEDWSLTRGYQLVAASRPEPEPAEIFTQVRACDFFACRVRSESHAPLAGLRVAVEDGEIVFSAGEPVDVIEMIGDGGRVLSTTTGARAARYRLAGDESYVRVRAFRAAGEAECFSQPLWIYR